MTTTKFLLYALPGRNPKITSAISASSINHDVSSIFHENKNEITTLHLKKTTTMSRCTSPEQAKRAEKNKIPECNVHSPQRQSQNPKNTHLLPPEAPLSNGLRRSAAISSPTDDYVAIQQRRHREGRSAARSDQILRRIGQSEACESSGLVAAVRRMQKHASRGISRREHTRTRRRKEVERSVELGNPLWSNAPRAVLPGHRSFLPGMFRVYVSKMNTWSLFRRLLYSLDTFSEVLFLCHSSSQAEPLGAPHSPVRCILST